MKTFFAAALAAISTAKLMTPGQNEFLRFVVKYGKNYLTTEEFEARAEIFSQFYDHVLSVNENPASGHRAAINAYSDNSPEEWDRMMGLKNVGQPTNLNGVFHELTDTPTSVDWRDSGCVTGVKDQGSCGSCWAFSSTGALEAASCIFESNVELLSEQQLVDCSWGQSNMGCSGGWYYWAYDYLSQGASLESESQYPYTGRNGTCADPSGAGDVTATGYVMVDGNSTAIKSAIAQQPVNIAVAAGNYHFQGYSSGILMASGCPTRIDHAILAVGYGSENGTEYYIVKNSWGTSWGESGYVRMEVTEGLGTCGMNQNVAYPTGV